MSAGSVSYEVSSNTIGNLVDVPIRTIQRRTLLKLFTGAIVVICLSLLVSVLLSVLIARQGKILLFHSNLCTAL